MAKYKYVRNLGLYDYTTSITLERNAAGDVTRSVGIDGVVDLTPAEYAKVSAIAVFEKVDDRQDEEVKRPVKGSKDIDR